MKSSFSPRALPSRSTSANPVSGSPKTDPKLKNASPSNDLVWSPVTFASKSPVRPGPVESLHPPTTRARASAARPRRAICFRLRIGGGIWVGVGWNRIHDDPPARGERRWRNVGGFPPVVHGRPGAAERVKAEDEVTDRPVGATGEQ